MCETKLFPVFVSGFKIKLEMTKGAQTNISCSLIQEYSDQITTAQCFAARRRGSGRSTEVQTRQMVWVSTGIWMKLYWVWSENVQRSEEIENIRTTLRSVSPASVCVIKKPGTVWWYSWWKPLKSSCSYQHTGRGVFKTDLEVKVEIMISFRSCCPLIKRMRVCLWWSR